MLERSAFDEIMKAAEEVQTDPPEPNRRPDNLHEYWAYMLGRQDERDGKGKKGEAG